ncbi:hypothetical protein SEA_GODONK_70 [Gordonia phage GodonK]|uniref:Uncharacterized protein n=1 Tax=Gordonia phage GodonK TaxID=2562192 RepID=A0A4D6E1Z2_9CAUD|nr:hypothetical protein HOV33_gp070 [Gordonia phage GodonK]QBZ72689.1 hypothetical protein SEA_GODONK_70 [Gordonia phage GodonK]
MHINPIHNREELVAAIKSGGSPRWYVERLAKAYGVDIDTTTAVKPDFREQSEEDTVDKELADAMEDYASGEANLEQTETMVAAIVARNYREGETVESIKEAFDKEVYGFLEHGRISNDEYATLVAAVTKTVRTREGQERFGQPLNTVIERDKDEPGAPGNKGPEPVARLDEVPVRRQPAPVDREEPQNSGAITEMREQFNNVTNVKAKKTMDEVHVALENADPVTKAGFAPSESDVDDDRPDDVREKFLKALRKSAKTEG